MSHCAQLKTCQTFKYTVVKRQPTCRMQGPSHCRWTLEGSLPPAPGYSQITGRSWKTKLSRARQRGKKAQNRTSRGKAAGKITKSVHDRAVWGTKLLRFALLEVWAAEDAFTAQGHSITSGGASVASPSMVQEDVILLI
ncbi:hypothetical protein AAY473_011569 [Plecturocebus cupreus]